MTIGLLPSPSDEQAARIHVDDLAQAAFGRRLAALMAAFDSRKPFRDVVKDARNWSGKVG